MEDIFYVFPIGYLRHEDKMVASYGGWHTQMVQALDLTKVVARTITMQQESEEGENIPCTRFSITSSDEEELKQFCIDRYRQTIPFKKKEEDWWAELDIGFITLFQEADGRYGFTLRMKTHVFTEEQFDSTLISFSSRDEDRLRDRMYADIEMVREMWRTRVNKKVLDVLVPFIHGPLKEYLEGCSYSRFEELINEAFGTTICYSDIYPSSLFGADVKNQD
jgi:hypothetical protein